MVVQLEFPSLWTESELPSAVFYELQSTVCTKGHSGGENGFYLQEEIIGLLQ